MMSLGGMPGQIANLILGIVQGEQLRGQIPKSPNLQEEIPQGPYRPGDKKFSPFTMDPKTAETLGINRQWAGEQGPESVTQLALQDTARQYEADKQKRAQEQQGLEGFQNRYWPAVQDMANRTRGDLVQTIGRGEQEFAGAKGAIKGAGQAADTGLVGSIASLQASVNDFKQQFQTSMGSMRQLKDEALSAAKDQTANLLVQQSTAMEKKTRAEYEEFMSGATAAGIPLANAENIGRQIRMQGANDMADQLRTLSTERTYQIDNIRMNADNNLSQLTTAFTGAFGGVTQQAMQGATGAYDAWADRKAKLADARRVLATDYSNWRATTNQNMSTIESMIQEANMRGAVIEKATIESMFIPSFELASIADAQLAYQTSEINTQFGYDQQEFANQAGITSFENAAVTNAFNNMMQYKMNKDQISAQRDASRMGLYGSIIGGGSSMVAGGLSNPNLFKSSNPTPGGFSGFSGPH
jgi:hypothetical protein